MSVDFPDKILVTGNEYEGISIDLNENEDSVEYIKNQWIKCSDKLPESDEAVFVNAKYDDTAYHINGKWISEDDQGYDIEIHVHHWYPMPKLPT